MGRERGQVADVFEQTCYRECMNPVLPTRMTVDEFLRWSQRQDSGRYELEDGRVISMPAETFGHVKIKDLVKDALKAAIARSSIPYISLPDGMAVRIDGKTAFEPDVLVVALPEPPLDALEIANPIIVVEVLSPSSARHDRITKRRFFLSHGVPTYWVIDGEAEAFEFWTPGDDRASLIDDCLVWQPVENVPAFELDVRRFFADVADEGP